MRMGAVDNDDNNDDGDVETEFSTRRIRFFVPFWISIWRWGSLIGRQKSPVSAGSLSIGLLLISTKKVVFPAPILLNIKYHLISFNLVSN